jgi:hypothetical protein
LSLRSSPGLTGRTSIAGLSRLNISALEYWIPQQEIVRGASTIALAAKSPAFRTGL